MQIIFKENCPYSGPHFIGPQNFSEHLFVFLENMVPVLQHIKNPWLTYLLFSSKFDFNIGHFTNFSLSISLATP